MATTYPIGSAAGGGVLLGNVNQGPTTSPMPVLNASVPIGNTTYTNLPGVDPTPSPAPQNPPATDPTKTNEGETIGGEPDIIVDGRLFSSQEDYDKWVQAGGAAAEQARNEINQGYDLYFQQLDEMLNTSLPASKTAQEGIVSAQKTKAESTLEGQKTQGLADLQSNRETIQGKQVKTLQDLAEDIRNQFRAGQIYLGARGAADSSAANQYAYAISKMGNKARGSVLSQTAELQKNVDDKEFALKNVYDTEMRNINADYDEKINQIGTWFADQQLQIQQMKASGQVQKGTDLANLSKQLLNNATQALLMAQQDRYNKESALQQWAMNNNTTISGLKSTLAQLSQGVNTNVFQPQFNGAIQTDAQGNMNYAPTGYGNSQDQYDQYGNKIA